MASELYNIIEGVSREKGIDPQIVVSAVEDAIVVATRKYYKTQENLRAVLDKDSGKINAYAVKAIVETPEQVEDPDLQVTVEQARKLDPSAHGLFNSIVLGGAYAVKGMGRFDDVLKPADAEAIHAWLIDQAWQLKQVPGAAGQQH